MLLDVTVCALASSGTTPTPMNEIKTRAMAERIGSPSTSRRLGPEARVGDFRERIAGCSVRRRTRGVGACHRRSRSCVLHEREPRNRVPPQHEACPAACNVACPTGLARTGVKGQLSNRNRARTDFRGETGRSDALDSATTFGSTATRGRPSLLAEEPVRARGLVPETRVRKGSGQSMIARGRETATPLSRRPVKTELLMHRDRAEYPWDLGRFLESPQARAFSWSDRARSIDPSPVQIACSGNRMRQVGEETARSGRIVDTPGPKTLRSLGFRHIGKLETPASPVPALRPVLGPDP